jgi:hypothetical protein
LKKWKRLCEPVFTGSSRAEVNLVPGAEKVIPEDVVQEYTQLKNMVN